MKEMNDEEKRVKSERTLATEVENATTSQFALSQQTADLLSAANMRQKLVAGSPLAEALYRHVLAMPQLPQRELLMAERKLQQLQSRRQAKFLHLMIRE